jgi:tRNA (guanine37-N1)-methyltransferase
VKFTILSLFPDYFDGPFRVSMLKRAQEKGLLEIEQVDIRDFAEDKHKKVDDRPFGGGPGMVLMAAPLTRAIRSRKKEGSRVILLSPQGPKLTAKKCAELAQEKDLILVCGHYEGVDERVMQDVDEEISIGDYVLTSGCAAAIVLIDSTIRFIPGVLGDEESAAQDSFQEAGLFDAPHYTRPVEFEGVKVPEVLLSGNHAAIARWRREKAIEKTKKVCYETK